jgi:FixJ family two-component response regulator
MSSDFSVFLVDDDPGVLKALQRLLNAKGYETKAFTSPRDFLAAHDPAAPGCAVLDLSMPGIDGLEVQAALTEKAGRQVIFLTGRADVPSAVRAMQAGAVDFLEKPVNGPRLLLALARAAERDIQIRKAGDERHLIEERINRLTPREFEVLRHVIAGRLNKQIAGDIGTVEKTVKVHRSRMMAKMHVRTVAELVRLTEKVGLSPIAA